MVTNDEEHHYTKQAAGCDPFSSELQLLHWLYHCTKGQKKMIKQLVLRNDNYSMYILPICAHLGPHKWCNTRNKGTTLMKELVLSLLKMSCTYYTGPSIVQKVKETLECLVARINDFCM